MAFSGNVSGNRERAHSPSWISQQGSTGHRMTTGTPAGEHWPLKCKGTAKSYSSTPQTSALECLKGLETAGRRKPARHRDPFLNCIISLDITKCFTIPGSVHQTLEVVKRCVDGDLGTWFSGEHNSAGLMVGFDCLRGLSKLNDSVILYLSQLHFHSFS